MSKKKRKYVQVLTELDDSKFVELRKRGAVRGDDMGKLHDNLWSMFDLKYTKDEMMKLTKKDKQPFGTCVADYAWTKEVADAFYNHPYHKRIYKQLKKMRGMTWGMWVLNSEPADYDRG